MSTVCHLPSGMPEEPPKHQHVACYRRVAPPRRLGAMASTTEDLQVTTPIAPVVTLTPEAHKIVREAIDQEPEPATLALWLEVRGVQGGSFVYDLYFQAGSD